MMERRWLDRKDAFALGLIESYPGGSVAYCRIRDRSRLGAKLKVMEAFDAPPFFLLTIEGESGTYRVEQIWRRDLEIGVKFSGPMAETSPDLRPEVDVPTRIRVSAHRPALRLRSDRRRA